MLIFYADKWGRFNNNPLYLLSTNLSHLLETFPNTAFSFQLESKNGLYLQRVEQFVQKETKS